MKENSKQIDAAALRRRAEIKVSERKKKTGPLPATDSDTRRLVHELQVHQIQLEMQNEELRRVQEELEESRAKYFDLYDLAPVGYLTLNAQGLILEANLTTAKLLDIEKSQLVKKPVARFIVREDQDIYYLHRQKLFETGAPQVSELRMTGKGGVPFWVQLDANLVCDAASGAPLCWVGMSDITARKQADEALRQLSTHDELTGLYSRGFFIEEMARLERGREFPVSIVMADVDHLKETNDQEGHIAGDALLKRVARVLTAAFRAEDVVARIGGDEFAVLLPGTDARTTEVVLRRVRKILQEHNAAQAGMLLRLSLGVSTAENPAPLSVVLKEADANMYCEKRGKDAS